MTGTVFVLLGYVIAPLMVTDLLEQSEHRWSDTAQLVGTLGVCLLVFVLYLMPVIVMEAWL